MRSSSATFASEIPSQRTLPAATSPAMADQVSSTGVSGSMR